MELGLSVGMAGSVEREFSPGSKDSVVREPEDDHPSLNLELRPAWLGDLEPGNGFSGGQISPHGCRNCETDHLPVVPLSIKTEKLQWRSCDEDDGSGQGTRKKLRLTKEQSCYLEQSFKEQATLNPKQKLAIARKLDLQPRQVEVWFQNRRARTKLKQTETDFEHLKRLCETLTVENQKLRRELEELKAFSSPLQQLYPLSPTAMLALCPSCERASAPGEAGKKLGGHRNRPKHRESFPHKLAYQVGQIH